MAEYIERKKLVNSLKMWLMDLENDMDKGDYGELSENKGAREALESCICEIEEQQAADVQPVRKWVNDNIFSPSVDGDYLVLYRGYFNVFERFRGKWFDEKGFEVDTKDLLWWQELPPMPEPIKG